MIFLLLYVFAIILHNQVSKEENLSETFGTLGLCMWTLWVHGALTDGFSEVMQEMLDMELYHVIVVFNVFLLLTSLTLMNMLIGVLCEVVTAVGIEEKEEAAIALVKSTLLVMLKGIDQDGSGN